MPGTKVSLGGLGTQIVLAARVARRNARKTSYWFIAGCARNRSSGSCFGSGDFQALKRWKAEANKRSVLTACLRGTFFGTFCYWLGNGNHGSTPKPCLGLLCRVFSRLFEAGLALGVAWGIFKFGLRRALSKWTVSIFALRRALSKWTVSIFALRRALSKWTVSIFALQESTVHLDSVHLCFAESIVHLDRVHLCFAASIVHVDHTLVWPVNIKNVLKNVLLRSAVRTECF